jgi:hypothetical protein
MHRPTFVRKSLLVLPNFYHRVLDISLEWMGGKGGKNCGGQVAVIAAAENLFTDWVTTPTIIIAIVFTGV